MFRFLIYLALVALAAVLAAWVADNPGRLHIDWLGYRIETSFAALVVFLFLLLFSGMIVQRLITLLVRDMPFSKEKRMRRRQTKGYAALNDAMIALAAGDKKKALKLTARADKLLPPQPLSHVMAAEAAKLAGDTQAALAHYQALATDNQAAFLGIRGLLMDAQAHGETEKALALAHKAVAEQPKSTWAIKTVFDLQTQQAEWKAAQELLPRLEKLGALDRAIARRHRAALLYAQAVDADLANDTKTATQLSREALSLRPGFVPAALLSTKLAVAAGEKKRAEKILQGCWIQQPHPALYERFLALYGTQTAHARLDHVKRLIAKNADHIESRLALAQAALDAERPDTAHKALDDLAASDERRVVQMRLQLARMEDDLHLAETLAKRLEAGCPKTGWHCKNCGTSHRRWSPNCPSCKRFDSLDWQATTRDFHSSQAITGTPIRLLTGDGTEESRGKMGETQTSES